jgi:hypothetical protein
MKKKINLSVLAYGFMTISACTLALIYDEWSAFLIGMMFIMGIGSVHIHLEQLKRTLQR